jgi:hypothetical protein
MPFDDPACFRLGRAPVRPFHWLWRPYLACGNPALLDGVPGAGKSLLTADLAVRRGPSGASAWPPGVCGRTAKHSGSGPIRPCRTAPDDADQGKADRPPSRAVSALRPWAAANPRRRRNELFVRRASEGLNRIPRLRVGLTGHSVSACKWERKRFRLPK